MQLFDEGIGMWLVVQMAPICFKLLKLRAALNCPWAAELRIDVLQWQADNKSDVATIWSAIQAQNWQSNREIVKKLENGRALTDFSAGIETTCRNFGIEKYGENWTFQFYDDPHQIEWIKPTHSLNLIRKFWSRSDDVLDLSFILRFLDFFVRSLKLVPECHNESFRFEATGTKLNGLWQSSFIAGVTLDHSRQGDIPLGTHADQLSSEQSSLTCIRPRIWPLNWLKGREPELSRSGSLSFFLLACKINYFQKIETERFSESAIFPDEFWRYGLPSLAMAL
jgi:hypothetical protein